MIGIYTRVHTRILTYTYILIHISAILQQFNAHVNSMSSGFVATKETCFHEN